MKSARIIKNKKLWLLISCLATILMVIIYSFSNHISDDPYDVLRIECAEGARENIAKLTSAVLVWNYERKVYGQWINKNEVKGKYQLWWNKNKIAISQDILTTVKGPNSQVTSTQEKTVSIYNDKNFLVAEMPTKSTGNNKITIQKDPEYKTNENYLQTIGWRGIGLLSIDFDESLRKHRSPGTERWTVVDVNDGSKLIKWEFHNSKTGQIGIKYYDPQQGFGIVCHESFASEGHLQYRENLQYVQVSGGAWFPVEYNVTDFNIQTGDMLAKSMTKIDMDKSVFNNPSAIPEDVFKFKIGPNDEVIDLTSLKTRLKRFFK